MGMILGKELKAFALFSFAVVGIDPGAATRNIFLNAGQKICALTRKLSACAALPPTRSTHGTERAERDELHGRMFPPMLKSIRGKVQRAGSLHFNGPGAPHELGCERA